MSAFRVNVVAANIVDQLRVTPPVQALVDNGSELTWLPADVLTAVGIASVRDRTFQTATGQTVQRPVGYAVLRAEGFETIDEVVLAEPGDATLLGVRTIEGFGVMVDYIAHRFIATTTIVANCSKSLSQNGSTGPWPVRKRHLYGHARARGPCYKRVLGLGSKPR